MERPALACYDRLSVVPEGSSTVAGYYRREESHTDPCAGLFFQWHKAGRPMVVECSPQGAQVGNHMVGDLDRSAITGQRRNAPRRKIYKEGRPGSGMTEHHHYQRQADPGPGYRSWAEVHIAGILDREDIAYWYEHPLAVVDQRQVRIWYPDFYLPEYGMIIEYFGINGDARYDRRTEHKLKVYETSGIEGVFLNEDTLKRQGPTGITRQIEGVLQQRLRRFYSRPAELEEMEPTCHRGGTSL